MAPLLYGKKEDSIFFDLNKIFIEARTNWAGYVDRLAEIIKKEAPTQKISLCGYSMGGRLALHLAQHFGSRVKSLILLSTGLGIENGHERTTRIALDKDRAAQLRKDPNLFWSEWYKQDIFAGLSGAPDHIAQSWKASKLARNREILALHLEFLGQASQDWALPMLSQEISIPTLYLVGEKDKKYVALSQRIREEAPNINVRVVAGAGHLLFLEAPGACAEAIRQFLEK